MEFNLKCPSIVYSQGFLAEFFYTYIRKVLDFESFYVWKQSFRSSLIDVQNGKHQ